MIRRQLLMHVGLLATLAVTAVRAQAAAATLELRPDAPHVSGDISPGNALASIYGPAAQSVIAALVSKLGLPFPPSRLLVFDDSADFEAALIEHLKLRPEVAKTTASFAKAAVSPDHLLLNHPAMQTIDREEQMITMAHEMTHLAQAALSGGRALWRYQWLTEGFAEWAAMRIVHEVGVADFAAQRKKMLGQVLPVWQAGRLADLSQMDRFDDWVKVRAERGFNATYPFAFFAVEFLIERHGLAKVLGYFRQFSKSANPASNFLAVFSESQQDFQLDLNVQLRKLFQP